MKFIDAAPIDGVRMHDDGYLVADARIVRTGIQHYTGREVGKPELAVVRVYRPESEVFHRDSLASFSHIPVTDDHPAQAVTADNWKDLAVGETSGEVLRDGERLRIPLIVKHGAAIQKVRDGKRELSAGYTCDLVFEDGTTPTGEAYDAKQTNIRANHLAIVQQGRAGSECRIGDSAEAWGAAPLIHDHKPEGNDMTMSTVVLGDKAVQVAATDAPAIEAFKADMKKQITDAETAHAAALAAKDKEIATKDAAIDDAKGKILSDADLDKRVQERADLIALAGAIAKDVKTAGLSDAAIRKAVVTAKLGDAAVAGKTEAYLDARFDILAEDAKKAAGADPLRAAIGDAAPAPTNVSDAYTQMLERDRNAWRSDAKKEA